MPGQLFTYRATRIEEADDYRNPLIKLLNFLEFIESLKRFFCKLVTQQVDDTLALTIHAIKHDGDVGKRYESM